tara:strand:- start:7 stop:315 length:309 start_codon:yes stop_codon:yes gene_type:complete
MTDTNPQSTLKSSKLYGYSLDEELANQIGGAGNDFLTGSGLLKYAERVTSNIFGGVTTSGANWACIPLNGRTIYTYASDDESERKAFRAAVSKLINGSSSKL